MAMVGEAREPETGSGPLDGITVLDASRVLAAPFCTMQLGDLGADVIKVERPGNGDQTRGWHPPLYGDSGESAYYVSINRNKRSITLDLSTAEGRDIFRTLAGDVDILVENFRVGKMETWDLGYEDLREDNPGLIYAHLTGYGEWGPAANRPAYDIVMQAEGGMMSITGTEDGEPVRVGVAIADIGAGMYATQAILAALTYRERDSQGRGQKIDVSLFDGQVAWMTYMASYYFATGSPPGRMGSKHPTIAPYQAFETADDHLVVAVSSEHMWPRFCAAIDREDLIDDPRFATNSDRVANRETLDELLASEFATRDTAEWVQILEQAGVPASPVRDMAEVFEDPQVEHRGMRARIDHPTGETIDMPASPMFLSRTPTSIRHHPPTLGEHSREILEAAGYDRETIDRFDDEGII